MSDIVLNPRQKQVLTALVDHYIIKAEPISSKILSQNSVIQASSATIRSTMVDLENLGMVEQPHSSSGRLPTDLGYRTYVGELMHPEPLRSEDRLVIDQGLAVDEGDEALLPRIAKLIADVSQLMGIVVTPAVDQTLLGKISVVPMDDGKAVLIITGQDSKTQSLMVNPGIETSVFHLEAMARRINQDALGKPVSFLNSYLDKPTEKTGSLDENNALEILGRSILKLSQSKVGEDIFLFGVKNLLNRPDFANFKDISSIMELFDSKITLVHFLRQRGDSEGVHVSVGEECQDGLFFRSLSLVTSAFNWGEARGMIGVLGPKRIPYARLVTIMQYTAQVLSKKRKENGAENT